MTCAIGRRAFLKRAAAAASAGVALPYLVPSSVLGNASGTSAGNRITVGCIGVGGRGTAVMQALLATGQAQVVGICEVDANRLTAVKNLLTKKYNSPDCICCTDFREIIARDDIDAVGLFLDTGGKDVYEWEGPAGAKPGESSPVELRPGNNLEWPSHRGPGSWGYGLDLEGFRAEGK